MSKMPYFSNKFSKNTKRWELSTPERAIIFNIGDLKSMIWSNCVFSSWLWRNRTSKVVMTSLPLRHHNNVTNFFQFAPPPPNQSFWLRQCLEQDNWARIRYFNFFHKYSNLNEANTNRKPIPFSEWSRRASDGKARSWTRGRNFKRGKNSLGIDETQPWVLHSPEEQRKFWTLVPICPLQEKSIIFTF